MKVIDGHMGIMETCVEASHKQFDQVVTNHLYDCIIIRLT